MATELTISNLYTYVLRTFKRTDKSSEFIDFYNDTVRDIASRRPFGNYKFQSYVSLVEGQEDYILPCDLEFLIHPVKYIEGSSSNDYGWPLNKISKQEYDERYINPNRTSPSNTSQPKEYCVYSRSILVGPIPNSDAANGGLLEMDWSKKPATLSGDNDSPLLCVTWKEILKYGILFRLYDSMEQFDIGDMWRKKYEDPLIGLPKMIRREVSIEGNEIGHVRPNVL